MEKAKGLFVLVFIALLGYYAFFGSSDYVEPLSNKRIRVVYSGGSFWAR